MSYLHPEVFLVTGANGFVGARAVRTLVEAGHAVRALSLEKTPHRLFDLTDKIEYHSGDLSDQSLISDITDGVDYVLHFAARGAVWRPSETFEQLVDANLLGTYRLINAAGKNGAKKVVVAGTVFEYGYKYGDTQSSNLGKDTVLNPINLYGVSKAASTMVAAHAGDEAGIETDVLRIFSPYGPAEQPTRFIPSVICAAIKNESVRMTPGLQKRDFCFVDDIVQAFIIAARTLRSTHSVFNLGTGRALTLLECAEIVISLLGSDSNILAGDIPYRDEEVFRLVADPSGLPEELKECLNTTFEDGILKTAEWMRQNREWWCA